MVSMSQTGLHPSTPGARGEVKARLLGLCTGGLTHSLTSPTPDPRPQIDAGALRISYLSLLTRGSHPEHLVGSLEVLVSHFESHTLLISKDETKQIYLLKLGLDSLVLLLFFILHLGRMKYNQFVSSCS